MLQPALLGTGRPEASGRQPTFSHFRQPFVSKYSPLRAVTRAWPVMLSLAMIVPRSPEAFLSRAQWQPRPKLSSAALLARPGLIDHEVNQLGREGPRQQPHPDPIRVTLTSYVIAWHKTETPLDHELLNRRRSPAPAVSAT